jgi:hypothetical protein
LFALAYNLANFLGELSARRPVQTWTLTTPREKLIKLGVKVVRPTKAITFPVVITFTANGQFTWEETNPLTGQVTTVQGSYTIALPPGGDRLELTLVSQGQIVFQGFHAQPGPGEFIIETFASWPLVGRPDLFSFFRQ